MAGLGLSAFAIGNFLVLQADPNYLWYTPFGEPKRLITRGGAGSSAAAGRVIVIAGV